MIAAFAHYWQPLLAVAVVVVAAAVAWFFHPRRWGGPDQGKENGNGGN